MLRCQGGCQQMYDEYYRMPDGKIFCEKCWRHGREIADMAAIQRQNQKLQVQREKDAFDQKLKEDKIRLEQLDHAIRLEKGKCVTAWCNYEVEYDSDKRPYNYEEVELLRRQYNDLRNQLDNRRFKYPDLGPAHLTTPSYFSGAQYISKSQSHYFETVTIPQEQEAARKAEEAARRAAAEAAQKAERERQEAVRRAEAEAAQKAERERREAARRAAAEAEELRRKNIASNVSISEFNCSVTHNADLNSQHGMLIQVEFIINNASNQDVECSAYFMAGNDDNNFPISNPSGQIKYKSTDGQFSVGTHITPPFQKTRCNKINLFIPYSEFQLIEKHLVLESFKLYYFINLFVNGIVVHRTECYSFRYNKGKTLPPDKRIAHKIAVFIIIIGVILLCIMFICIGLGL